MNWSITSTDVIKSVLANRPGQSLIRLGDACALVEKASSDSAFTLGSHYRALVYNVAVELASVLDADAIAAAMIYQLPSLISSVHRESVERILGAPGHDGNSVLAHELLRFSGLEWNTWPSVPSNYRSEETHDMLRSSFLFAVGPVTEEERRSPFFRETASHKRERQVPNLVNLLSTLSADWRVPYVKIAERVALTQMLTRQDMRAAISIDAIMYARINLAVYASLAERQGAWQLKSALEDASLELLDPAAYRAVETAMGTQETREAEKLERIISAIQKCLADEGISHTAVCGRRKHIYSIYRKMKSKGLPPDEMIDLFAVRIVVKPTPTLEERSLEARLGATAATRAAADTELRTLQSNLRVRMDVMRKKASRAKEEAVQAARTHSQLVRELNQASKRKEAAAIQSCYRAFAALRARWMPVQDSSGVHDMRDWIRFPKENGYQSIHTALLIDGVTVEVQIRTAQMHQQAEFGTAAHSKYKSEKSYGSLQPVAAPDGT